MKAILAYRTDKDTILLNNGKSLINVDQESFRYFSEAPNFDQWQGSQNWDDRFTIEEASTDYGLIVAFYDNNNNLVIVDDLRWAERKRFYLGE
ncbi:MAG: hypothetical protein ACYC4E_00395 [Carboxydocellales bacterium]